MTEPLAESSRERGSEATRVAGGPQSPAPRRWHPRSGRLDPQCAVPDLHPGLPVVWIDADAVVRRRPELFWGLEADVAAYRWEWPDRPLDEILEGTVYLANNDRSRAFLGVWEGSRAEDGCGTDQPALRLAIERTPGLRFVSLPVEYTVTSSPA